MKTLVYMSRPLGYCYQHFTWNPFVIPYHILRILIQVFIGRKRSDSLFCLLGWSSEYGWLEWLGLSHAWIYKFTVKAIRRNVSRRFFRYEPEVSDFIEKRHGDLFIDIGAGLGYYSFLLYNNFKEIIAFEPYPDNIAIINEVKRLEGYSNIKVFGMAVGDKNGRAKLFIGQHLGLHSLLGSSRSIKDGSFIVVPITTLTTFLSNKILPRNVDLVKVDVEGAEQMVLRGAESVMEKIGSWIIEVHDTNRLGEMKKSLQSYGYKTRFLDRYHIYAWKV